MEIEAADLMLAPAIDNASSDSLSPDDPSNDTIAVPTLTLEPVNNNSVENSSTAIVSSDASTSDAINSECNETVSSLRSGESTTANESEEEEEVGEDEVECDEQGDEEILLTQTEEQNVENSIENTANEQDLISSALVLLQNHDSFSSSSGVDADSIKHGGDTTSSASTTDSDSRNKSPAEILIEIEKPQNSIENELSGEEVNLEIVNLDLMEPGAPTPTNQTIIPEEEIIDNQNDDEPIANNETEETETVIEIVENRIFNEEPEIEQTETETLEPEPKMLEPEIVTEEEDGKEEEKMDADDQQVLTIETHSSSYNNSPRNVEETEISCNNPVNNMNNNTNVIAHRKVDGSESGGEDDTHLRRHLENLQRVPFGRSRAEICRNCTSFDEAVARTQRDAVFSDQQMWRNLQFVIREKYTSFAKLEAISRIQEKIQELVGFIDSSVLTNSCWSSSANRLLPNSAAKTRGSASPSATKEAPEDLAIMLQLFSNELEASNALTNWLTQSIEGTCIHLENAAKFYQFECELGHCFGWMVNSLEAASLKLDQLVETGYCNWQQKAAASSSNDEAVTLFNNKHSSVPATVAASDWLAASFQEIENCAKLLYFWQDKVDRLFASCRRLSPVNKRSPTQRGIYTPADVASFTAPTPYYSPTSVTNSSKFLISATAPASSSSSAIHLLNNNNNCTSNISGGLSSSNNAVPARLLLDYSSELNRGVKVNVSRMNTGRSAELPHYWTVEMMPTASNERGGYQPTCDIPNYVCELTPTESEMQERQDAVSEIAGLLVTSGRRALRSLHNFVAGFIRVNFPPLDDQRASLLMGLELSEKLDSLNVIDETLAFVEHADYLSDERDELLELLHAYRTALLNERKTNDNFYDQQNFIGTRSALVVTNVELLKQLLGKAKQLDSYWDAFAERALNLRGGLPLPDQEDQEPIRQKNVANWYKMIDLEGEHVENIEHEKQKQADAAESRPICLPIFVDSAVQTDEMTFTPAEPIRSHRESIEENVEYLAAPVLHERPSSSSEHSVASSGGGTSSVESDLVVHQELAEERRRFTIKGVIRSTKTGSSDLMSLRDAIMRGIIDQGAGTCKDLDDPSGEPIPIPVAIQRGFIVVEHQSETEVLRREQKTEHVVVSRPGSRHYRHQRPTIFEHVINNKPAPSRSSGTTIFVSDNDAPPVVTIHASNCGTSNNSAISGNLFTAPPPYSYSVSPPISTISPKSISAATTRPTSTSPIIEGSGVSVRPGTSNSTTVNKANLVVSPSTSSGSHSGSRPSSAVSKSNPAANNNHNKPKAVLINREKLATSPTSAPNKAVVNKTSPTFIASAYVDDDTTNNNNHNLHNQTNNNHNHNHNHNNNHHNNSERANQHGHSNSGKPRTPAMSLLVKKLEQDLVLRTASGPPENNNNNNKANNNVHPSSSKTSATNNGDAERTVIIKEKDNSADPSPKPPVRSQVGSRGSVRKIAKFFERK